jgi:hypothetical protein
VVLADFLKRRGVVARTAAVGTAIENDTAEAICVCFLEDVTAGEVDFTIRKLPVRRQQPKSSSASWEMPRMGATKREARMLRRGRLQPR